MPSDEPVRTPDEDSLDGIIAGLEEELAELRVRLPQVEREAAVARAELRRARIRADELQSALQQKQEQFLDMLARLQHREEQAVRRAGDLAERTREAEDARRRAVDAERQIRRIMVEAGRLTGSSLDSRSSLAAIAKLAAPELADWCIIDVFEPDGRTERVSVQPPDESGDELARRLMDECESGPGFGLYRLLGDGDGEASLPVDATVFRSLGCGPEIAAAMAGLGLARILVLPMASRGRLMGALALMAPAERPEYDEDDLVLARELAHRAALAVDNARLYDAALAGSRAKSEFLAVMSHELRTPLSAVIGYADLIRTGVVGAVSEKQEQYVGRIRSAADHLLALIDEILSYSQLEAGRLEIEWDSLDAAELARELVAMVEPMAAGKGLRLALRAPDTPVTMTTDGAKLRQILLNLLSNAIKFTDEGDVRLTLDRTGDRIRWRIIDSGVGIDAAQMDDIFTPFWQAEQSRTRSREGAGLGLSVSRALAHALGGDIEVESEPGHGSTFTLLLPAHGGEREAEE